MSTLKPGDKLPQFEAVDHLGNKINHETLKGKKTVIYFYPKDMTPGCTDEACNLRDNYTLLQQNNYNVIGISPDTEKSHIKFAEKHKLPFPLIPDTNKTLAKLFGVWGRKKFMGREYDGINRTTFIVDENLNIEEVIDKVNTKQHTAQIIKPL